MKPLPLARHKLAVILWILLALFCFRVTAQLIQGIYPLSLLPPFERWHSAKMPYGVLLSLQLIIIFVCSKTALNIYRGTSARRPVLGKFLFVGGSLYFFIMVARLSLGITVFSEHPWFSQHIPTFFHFVLATFSLLVSNYHFQKPVKAVQ